MDSNSNEIQFMMDNYAESVSFYLFTSTIEAFSDELKDYKLGKGAVQFTFGQDLPKELIKKMVVFEKG